MINDVLSSALRPWSTMGGYNLKGKKCVWQCEERVTGFRAPPWVNRSTPVTKEDLEVSAGEQSVAVAVPRSCAVPSVADRLAIMEAAVPVANDNRPRVSGQTYRAGGSRASSSSLAPPLANRRHHHHHHRHQYHRHRPAPLPPGTAARLPCTSIPRLGRLQGRRHPAGQLEVCWLLPDLAGQPPLSSVRTTTGHTVTERERDSERASEREERIDR